MPETFDGIVIQIDMKNLQIFIFHTIHIYGETMILGGNFNFCCFEILDGLVSSTVTKF